MAAYTGLYLQDAYDAVIGGDPVNDGPVVFDKSADPLVYSGTDYAANPFPPGNSGKTVIFALTRKNDGKTLTGLTKLATFGSYGAPVIVGANGTLTTGLIGPGQTYSELSVSSLTEVSVQLSNYGDPIALWLPGATLEDTATYYQFFGSNVLTARQQNPRLDIGYIDLAPFAWTHQFNRIRITTDLFSRYSLSDCYVSLVFSDGTETSQRFLSQPMEIAFPSGTTKSIQAIALYYNLVVYSPTPLPFYVTNVETDQVLFEQSRTPQLRWKDYVDCAETLGPAILGGPFTNWGSTAPLTMTVASVDIS